MERGEEEEMKKKWQAKDCYPRLKIVKFNL